MLPLCILGTIAWLGGILGPVDCPEALKKNEALPPAAFFPPPRLAIDPQRWQTSREGADFANRKEAAIARAQTILSRPLPLPDGPASWIFYYSNPETGNRLRPISRTEHEDPVTGKRFSDERTNAAYLAVVHGNAEDAAEALGWAALYSGDSKYAAASREILLHLANQYPSYPDRKDRWGRSGILAPLGGRRYVQSLDEAYGIIRLAKAYDLTRAFDVYSPEDRRNIEENLFRATADTLLRFNQGINNHQTWYNAGLLSIACILEDEALARRVLSMRGGFFDQLERSIKADGLWYEGAMAYHKYALLAMVEIVNAAERMGWTLGEEPKFRAMFYAPVLAAYPNGVFPAINDSDRADLTMFREQWKYAWQQWRDPLFARLQAGNDPAALASLLGAEAALEWPPEVPSKVFEDSGLVYLRKGSREDAVCAILDFGPHGGGHGHFDKLQLLLFSNGKEWLLDPGRLSYSQEEYKTWVKTTAAHNTVVLNESNQNAATGELLYFQEEPGFAAAGTATNDAYPGTRLRRDVVLCEDLLLDVFQVRSNTAHQVDLFAHADAASLELLPPLSSNGEKRPEHPLPTFSPITPGTRDGYQHLQDAEKISLPGNSVWQWKDAAGRILQTTLLGAPGEELIRCTAIGHKIEDRTPTLLRRRHAKNAVFAALYDFRKNAHAPVELQQLSENPPEFLVTTSEGPKRTLRIKLFERGVEVELR